MTLSPNGILFVGSRDAGVVYAVLDRKKQNRADQVITIDRRTDLAQRCGAV